MSTGFAWWISALPDGLCETLALLGLSNRVFCVCFLLRLLRKSFWWEAGFCRLWLWVGMMGRGVLNPFRPFLGRVELRMDLAICETPSLSPCNTIKEPPDSSTWGVAQGCYCTITLNSILHVIGSTPESAFFITPSLGSTPLLQEQNSAAIWVYLLTVVSRLVCLLKAGAGAQFLASWSVKTGPALPHVCHRNRGCSPNGLVVYVSGAWYVVFPGFLMFGRGPSLVVESLLWLEVMYATSGLGC